MISNEDLNDLLEVIKSLEKNGILLDGITETVKNEGKEQKGGFLSMLLGTLASSGLTDIFLGKKSQSCYKSWRRNS